MRLLTEAEFKATIADPPRPRSNGESAPFDFWTYFDGLPRGEWQGHDFSSGRVTTAYVMNGDRWEHVLLASEDPNVNLVLVLDLDQAEVHGHYLLDLNQVYGLTDR